MTRECTVVTVLPAQGFAHNRIEFSNWWLTAREDRFPNFTTGNVAGDGLFKVLPAEILERHGAHRLSGYRIGFSIDDAYTGRFPVTIKVPGMQLYRTVVKTLGGKLYETLGEQFGPTWARMRQAYDDVVAGRGPNGEPAGTWEPDRDPDEGYDLDDPKHPTFGERFAAGADYARKAARENA